jgi:probable phosphoglycerate mutase
MARCDVYRVLLVRSGATEWDEREHLPGLADLPLCAGGRERFVIDGAGPGVVPLRAVISAGDQASVESARLVASAFETKARMCHGLCDVDLGLWQGLRMCEVKDRYPKVHRQWIDDPLSLTPPEGEPLRAAQNRLVEEMATCIEKACKGGKSPNPAVAVVLRPIALALVRARLLEDASLVCWSRLAASPAYEWHRILPERLDTLRWGSPSRV